MTQEGKSERRGKEYEPVEVQVNSSCVWAVQEASQSRYQRSSKDLCSMLPRDVSGQGAATRDRQRFEEWLEVFLEECCSHEAPNRKAQ